MTKPALLFVAAVGAALLFGACDLVVATPVDGGGVCHTSAQSCQAASDCCEGFICVIGQCLFQGGGNDGTAASGGSSGGSSGSGSTGHVNGGSSGGSTHGASGGPSSGGGTSTGSTGSGTHGGSSGGTSGGCAGPGASCQDQPCCGGQVCLYGESCQSCEAQNAFCELDTDCCAGLSCLEEACAPTPTCAAYDQSCASEGCCAGLTCDSTYHYCYLPEGSSCTGAEAICATPYTCLASGLCGTAPTCSNYESSCASSPCCDGLTCSSGVCYVGYDEPCNGSETICAPPYTCLASGVCGTAPSCGSYETEGCLTSGVACCSGLTCDTTYDDCFVSYGDSCTGGYQCASPYTCLSDGYCGTAPACSAYATSCATTACCAGLTCDTSDDICFVADGYSCVDGDSVCDPPDTCQASGVCGPASSCSPYGTNGCETSGVACCSGLTCDTTEDYCLVAYGEPCTGELCASPYTCLSSGYCGTVACSGYGSSDCAANGCCSGYLCDETYDECLVAPGYSCSGGDSCADGYSCTYFSSSGEYVCEAPSSCVTLGTACTPGGEACCSGYTCEPSGGGYFCL